MWAKRGPQTRCGRLKTVKWESIQCCRSNRNRPQRIVAFSIFSKKDGPRAPAKKPAAVPAVKQPAIPDAGASTRARTAPQLTQKIDQIQSEMEEFALDFTSPPPSRPATPTPPAAPAARPPAAVPSAPAAATAAAPAPAAVAAAPVSSAPASPMRAVPAPGGAAPAMPAPAAPPASRAKPVIERGFDPLARSAPKPRAAALVKPGAVQPAAPAAAAPVLHRPC